MKKNQVLEMKTKTILTLSLFLFLTPLLLTGIAYASPPAPISGTWTPTGAVVNWNATAGGNTIISQTGTMDMTGSFTGTMVANETSVIHPNGKINGRALGTFTGTVDGASGTLLFRYAATGDALTGDIQGNWVILSGTGGLANLRGQGTFEGTLGAIGTYSGQIHFGP